MAKMPRLMPADNRWRQLCSRVVYAPALKGCESQGEAKEEALKDIKETMEACIEALADDGPPAPSEVGKGSVGLEGGAR